MKKRKKWDITSKIILVVGISLFVVSFSMLVSTLLDYKNANDTYEDLKDKYVTVKEEIKSQDEAQTIEGVVNDSWWYEDVDIQLHSLQQENSDIVGWILFENNDMISYPVLYSGDNEKYIRSDIYGNSTTAGCIFLEGACTPDFNDCHTIIYGHNMKNLSMFGSLKKYKTEDYYEGHQYFMIYTNDMAYRYQIFAYYDIPEDDDVYQVGFSPDDTFQTFVNDMKRHSYEDTGVSVTKDDKVITLSTCSTDGYRFVVHAVRVDEHSCE